MDQQNPGNSAPTQDPNAADQPIDTTAQTQEAQPSADSTQPQAEQPAEATPSEQPVDPQAPTSEGATGTDPQAAPADGTEAPATENPPDDGSQPTDAPADGTPSDGQPSADQPAQPATDPAKPTDAKQTAPVKTNKMGGIIKKALPVVVVLILMGIAGGAGYFLGSSRSNKSAAAPAAQKQEASDSAQNVASSSATAQNLPPAPPCLAGYKPYVSKLFSICYPQTMTYKETDDTASSSAETAKAFVFADDVETLTVQTDYKENLNKYTCVSSKVVDVAGISAQRYLIKDAGKTAGTCASTISFYATLISAGNDKPVYYIGLAKKNGSYQSDNGAFAIIEQSFQINQ